MNQRIRELWRDCVLKHTKDPMNWQTVADEFAQLIVQECLDTIQRDNEGFGSTNEDLLRGGQFTQLVAYRHIQARFGMGPYQDQESSGVES